MCKKPNLPIILASSSVSRAMLLKKIHIPISQIITPNINEIPLHNELPNDLAKRLAKSKLEAAIQKYNHIRDNFLLNLQEQKIIEEYLDNELFQGKKEIFYQNFLYLKDNIACIINLFNIANKKSSTDILKTASIKIFQYMHDKRIELQEDDVSWNYSLFNISSLKILNLLNQNTPIDSITDVTLYKEFQTSLSNIKMKKTEIACKKSTIPKPQESMANLEKNPHNNHGINFTCLIQIEGENKNENLNKQILMGTQDDFEFCIHVKNSNENNEFLKFYDTNFLDFFGTEYSQFKTIVDIDSCYKKIYELSSLHSKEIDVNDIKKLGLIDTNINKYSVTKALYFIKESIANPLSPNKSISITDICPELEETHALISHIYETNAPLLSKNTELIDKVLIFIIISSPNNYFNDKIIPSLENVDWKPLYKEICKSDIIIHKKIIEKFINKNFPSTTPISLNLLLEKFIDIAFTNKITSDEFINLAKAMFAKEELLFASQKIQEAFEKTFSFENIHIPQQHENIYMPQQQFNDQVPIKEVIGNSIEDSSIFQEFPDY